MQVVYPGTRYPGISRTSVGWLGILLIAAIPVLFTLPGCGQSDPPSGPEPEPRLGSIAVFSSSPGAAIALDGAGTGRVTPDTLEEVSEGNHSVSVTLTGFGANPSVATVAVTNGATTNVLFTMNALVHRTVLLEHFTNWFCAPCVQSDPELDSLYHNLPRDTVVYIAYHENIASQNDPFFLANPLENLDRMHHYAVTGSPWVGLDGHVFSLGTSGWESPLAYGILHDSTLAHAASYSPVTIAVSGQIVGGVYQIRAEVSALSDLGAGTFLLHVVIVEKEPVAGPGIAGQTVYPWAMRDMIPDADGEPLSMAVGDTVNVAHDVPFDPAWDPDEVGVVVFVQRDDPTKAVIQAGSTF